MIYAAVVIAAAIARNQDWPEPKPRKPLSPRQETACMVGNILVMVGTVALLVYAVATG